ncbi:hypothetical protein D8674_038904 [Pyrus ussuriensis x Pyrus communis]|uniref:Uncharacterized protein n=1 Tax=Pyrus ussuriensis x Pyrus communis TaxID=2448454 RepID=A0A5N5IFT8_9ROSA|nr:hypothetical protein D8674_040536 [Pyrus ussuriensis x Pyrus communis]KAB2634184.1 hypothetical protein D8674_038904 [Pyrus ussuriensis x Pyrus communis]
MCCIGCIARICTCICCSIILTVIVCLLLGLGPIKRFKIIKTHMRFVESCEPSYYGSLCKPGRPFLGNLGPSPSWLDEIAPSPF